MSSAFIREGDTTSHGGRVLACTSTNIVFGKPLALEGDMVSCPKCSGVYLACEGACVISGCTVVKALDAAHKHGRNWKLGHNSASDGYLLRKDLHALYDNHLLWISDDGAVELHPTVFEHYKQFSGVKLTNCSSRE
ncbi:PAAR domain-containing protein [Burkholderia gladioli]|uniref:PAAR domain-containing protein n=1 Tax=Burkholderia gladioli TaxID=28095 RepID=UPI001F1BAD5E|nr:PAAR domain-containing protein [Burkholderia gladioli]MDZ4040911.1 PAAR domain-containing protein [Burkholderia gladioli pv. alliicola]